MFTWLGAILIGLPIAAIFGVISWTFVLISYAVLLGAGFMLGYLRGRRGL